MITSCWTILRCMTWTNVAVSCFSYLSKCFAYSFCQVIIEADTFFREFMIDFSGDDSISVILSLKDSKISSSFQSLYFWLSSSYPKSSSRCALVKGRVLSSGELTGKECCFPSCNHIFESTLSYVSSLSFTIFWNWQKNCLTISHFIQWES